MNDKLIYEALELLRKAQALLLKARESHELSVCTCGGGRLINGGRLHAIECAAVTKHNAHSAGALHEK